MRTWIWFVPVAGFVGMLSLAFGLQPKAVKSSPYLPSPLDTQVFGQTRWLAGSKVALKIVTMDRQKQKPVRAKVRVAVGQETVFAGVTDESGSVDAQFRAPSQAGSYPLSIFVQSPIGDDRIEPNGHGGGGSANFADDRQANLPTEPNHPHPRFVLDRTRFETCCQLALHF
jgi:hypothetical protein